MTLSLNRISKGDYEKKAGAIRISLNNPFIMLGEGSNAWQLTIEIAGEELVSEYFDTKAQGSKFGAQFINSL
tara:strand:+ start:407 stop:622 length:216 start_codon:yes stop_codon:yes gene_type:complete